MRRPIPKTIPSAVSRALCAALALLLIGMALPAAAQDSDAPKRPRPRITVHPRAGGQLPSTAKRYCHAQLVKEYRVSGPVIVPRMQCWWQ
jgi:hypothetical protein